MELTIADTIALGGGELSEEHADTRTKLLAAAERILVERGLVGVSVRKVGEAAGVNATLVTYHFKSIARLLDELCRLNLEPIMDRWAQVGLDDGRARSFDELLRLWIEPMLLPSAFTSGGQALVVLDEIAAHGEGALRQSVLEAMEGFSRRLQRDLAPFCPHLDRAELRVRLRFIASALIGPPPRCHGAPVLENGRRADDLDYLLAFARAALLN